MALSGSPTLPFSREEHGERVARLRRTLRERGFDAMLVFAQESHYWLTGYDTGGFVYFQCAVVTADERPIVLLTRRPDLLQARQTSTMEDARALVPLAIILLLSSLRMGQVPTTAKPSLSKPSSMVSQPVDALPPSLVSACLNA